MNPEDGKFLFNQFVFAPDMKVSDFCDYPFQDSLSPINESNVPGELATEGSNRFTGSGLVNTGDYLVWALFDSDQLIQLTVTINHHYEAGWDDFAEHPEDEFKFRQIVQEGEYSWGEVRIIRDIHYGDFKVIVKYKRSH